MPARQVGAWFRLWWQHYSQALRLHACQVDEVEEEEETKEDKVPLEEDRKGGGSGSLAALRQTALQRCSLGLEHSLRPDGRLARPLLAALRVLAAGAPDLERVRCGRINPFKARRVPDLWRCCRHTRCNDSGGRVYMDALSEEWRFALPWTCRLHAS